jgi:hypothetical protein
MVKFYKTFLKTFEKSKFLNEICAVLEIEPLPISVTGTFRNFKISIPLKKKDGSAVALNS